MSLLEGDTFVLCKACASAAPYSIITSAKYAGTPQQRAGQAAPAAAEPGADANDDADQLDVSVSVKDSGMRLVTALSHDVRWESGAAEVRLLFRASALEFAPILVHGTTTSWPSDCPLDDDKLSCILQLVQLVQSTDQESTGLPATKGSCVPDA